MKRSKDVCHPTLGLTWWEPLNDGGYRLCTEKHGQLWAISGAQMAALTEFVGDREAVVGADFPTDSESRAVSHMAAKATVEVVMGNLWDYGGYSFYWSVVGGTYQLHEFDGGRWQEPEAWATDNPEQVLAAAAKMTLDPLGFVALCYMKLQELYNYVHSKRAGPPCPACNREQDAGATTCWWCGCQI